MKDHKLTLLQQDIDSDLTKRGIIQITVRDIKDFFTYKTRLKAAQKYLIMQISDKPIFSSSFSCLKIDKEVE